MEADSNPLKVLAERRRLPRLNFTEPVQYRSLFKPHETYSGSLARDLSAGGVRIIHYAGLAKESRVILLIDLPGTRRSIRLIARVAWNRERPLTSGYETGLQFIEITPEDRDSIAGSVEQGVVS